MNNNMINRERSAELDIKGKSGLPFQENQDGGERRESHQREEEDESVMSNQ